MMTMKKWAMANDIGFPIHIFPSGVLMTGQLDHSIVMLLRSDGGIGACGRIPLSQELQKDMIEELTR
jgi:hypothetical protein